MCVSAFLYICVNVLLILKCVSLPGYAHMRVGMDDRSITGLVFTVSGVMLSLSN